MENQTPLSKIVSEILTHEHVRIQIETTPNPNTYKIIFDNITAKNGFEYCSNYTTSIKLDIALILKEFNAQCKSEIKNYKSVGTDEIITILQQNRVFDQIIPYIKEFNGLTTDYEAIGQELMFEKRGVLAGIKFGI